MGIGDIGASRYIPNVRDFLREHYKFFLAFAAAGLLLRLLFFFYFPAITDDSRNYADFAQNWLQHAVYGLTEDGKAVPTDSRLPGYPGFLVIIFALFGVGNFKAAMLAQIPFELATCLLIANLAFRTAGRRAAKIAFVLNALCPFLANYAAAALTETLEIFFTALALSCATTALDRIEEGRSSMKFWAGAGAAIAACILLRPDGGILLASLGLYMGWLVLRKRNNRQQLIPLLIGGVLTAFIALAPLIPWGLRNLRTLHRFEPLVPRYATEADELVPHGFNRWTMTWIVDYASVEEIFWTDTGLFDASKLPSRAFDSAAQRTQTVELISEYNQSKQFNPELDRRFGEVAEERIRTHPLRYYLELPVLRVADMWLRPRTEMLPPDVRWWEFNDAVSSSITAVGFGVLNLAYVAAALLALFRRPLPRYAGLLIVFVVLRSAFLGTVENPEPRYTLECYPVVILMASALIHERK